MASDCRIPVDPKDIRHYLARVPTFMDGATRISSLFGDATVYRTSNTPEDDDFEALANDWSVSHWYLREAFMAEMSKLKALQKNG